MRFWQPSDLLPPFLSLYIYLSTLRSSTSRGTCHSGSSRPRARRARLGCSWAALWRSDGGGGGGERGACTRVLRTPADPPTHPAETRTRAGRQQKHTPATASNRALLTKPHLTLNSPCLLSSAAVSTRRTAVYDGYAGPGPAVQGGILCADPGAGARRRCVAALRVACCV